MLNPLFSFVYGPLKEAGEILFKFIYSITIRNGKKPDDLSPGLVEVFIAEGISPGFTRTDIKQAITSNAAVLMYKTLILFTCISLGPD